MDVVTALHTSSLVKDIVAMSRGVAKMAMRCTPAASARTRHRRRASRVV
jgi:hypothetical protein